MAKRKIKKLSPLEIEVRRIGQEFEAAFWEGQKALIPAVQHVGEEIRRIIKGAYHAPKI